MKDLIIHKLKEIKQLHYNINQAIQIIQNRDEKIIVSVNNYYPLFCQRNRQNGNQSLQDTDKEQSELVLSGIKRCKISVKKGIF